MQVDRRTFLAAAGAAIASTSGFAKSAPQQPAAKRRIKKAVKFGMIGAGATLHEKFAILRDCGFDGVEMDSPNDFDPDEVLKARDASGLNIPGVVDSAHWRDTLSHPDAAVRDKGRSALETAIRDCKTYGGTSLLLVPAVVKKDVSYADAWQRSQDEIRKVLPLCRELDIRIAIENVWNNFLLSPLEAARYTDEIDPQWVGWHFDIGNIVNYGWPEHWIRTLGKRIWKLDIKEFSRKKRDDEGLWKGFDVELMEGDCGWPEVMTALDEIGYEGWAAAEVAGGDAVRMKFLAERMDKIFSL